MIPFLLRHYATPGLHLLANKQLMIMVLFVPVVAINAWLFPAESAWIGAAASALGVAVYPSRASRFESALPIAGRDIAIANTLLAIARCAVILIGTVCVGVWWGKTYVPGADFVLAAMSLVTIVFTSQLPKAREFDVQPLAVAPAVLLTAGASALLAFAMPVTLAFAVLSILVLATGAWWWITLPASFQMAPVEARKVRERAVRSGLDRVDGAATFPFGFLARVLVSKHRYFVFALMFYGGLTASWSILFLVITNIGDLTQRAKWLQQFPLSHRVRLVCVVGLGVVLPWLLVLAGMEVRIPGMQFVNFPGRSAPSLPQDDSVYFSNPTNVSLERWKTAPNTGVPIIVSPWGESVSPHTLRLFGKILYNPFSTRRGNSERFADWQYARLTTAVYGVPMRRSDHDETTVFPRRETSKLRMMLLNISLVLSGSMLLVFWMSNLRLRWFWNRTDVVNLVTIGTLFIPGSVWIYTMFWTLRRQGVTAPLFPLIEGQLLRLSAALPANNLWVAILAIIPVGAAYALLEWQFRNSELLDRAPKF